MSLLPVIFFAFLLPSLSSLIYGVKDLERMATWSIACRVSLSQFHSCYKSTQKKKKKPIPISRHLFSHLVISIPSQFHLLHRVFSFWWYDWTASVWWLRMERCIYELKIFSLYLSFSLFNALLLHHKHKGTKQPKNIKILSRHVPMDWWCASYGLQEETIY